MTFPWECLNSDFFPFFSLFFACFCRGAIYRNCEKTRIELLTRCGVRRHPSRTVDFKFIHVMRVYSRGKSQHYPPPSHAHPAAASEEQLLV